MTDKLQNKSGIQNVAPSKNITWSMALYSINLGSLMYSKLFIWLKFILRHDITLGAKKMV